MLTRVKERLRRFLLAPKEGHASLRSALSEQGPLEECRTVLDVGANTGQMQRVFAQFFPQAVIHSLEPDPTAFAALSKAAFGNPRLKCHNLALGEQAGTLELNLNSASVTNSFLGPAAASQDMFYGGMMTLQATTPVQVSTLPEFCAAQGIAHIGLLKLDTQGFEDRILRGAKDWLSPVRAPAVLLEALFAPIYENQAAFDEVYALLRARGYKLHSIHDIESRQPQGWLFADALFVGRP
jgi:FkbM family methyltransferase